MLILIPVKLYNSSFNFRRTIKYITSELNELFDKQHIFFHHMRHNYQHIWLCVANQMSIYSECGINSNCTSLAWPFSTAVIWPNTNYHIPLNQAALAHTIIIDGHSVSFTFHTQVCGRRCTLKAPRFAYIWWCRRQPFAICRTICVCHATTCVDDTNMRRPPSTRPLKPINT